MRKEGEVSDDQAALLRAIHDAHGPALLRYALRLTHDPKDFINFQRAAFLGLPVSARPHGVAVHELGRDRLVAVVAPDHPLAAGDAVDLRRLAEKPFVDLPAGTAGRVQSDEAFEAAGLSREVPFEVTTADYIAQLVAPGLAVAMVPVGWAPQLSGVTVVEVTDAPQRVECVIWREGIRTPAAAAFLEILEIA